MAAITSAPAGTTFTFRLEKRKCGNKKCRSCRNGEPGTGHGPYWYAYWHNPFNGNRLVSSYLGKTIPAGYEKRVAKGPISSTPKPSHQRNILHTEETISCYPLVS